MQGTMKAARLHHLGEAIYVDDVPIPDIGPGEVLLRVLRAGLNRGDVHMRDGHIRIQPGEEGWYFPVLPLTIGHDGLGEVAEVGPGVQGLKVGDRCIARPRLTCGLCKFCRSDREHNCPHLRVMGYVAHPRQEDIFLRYKDGFWAEYCRIPAANLDLLQAEDEIDELCLVAQISVGYRALKRARLGVGETVMVNGGSGITGTGTVLAALAMGAAHVIVVARDPARLGRMRQIDPRRVSTISILTESIRERAVELAGGEGPSVLVDINPGDLQSTVDCLYALEPGGRACFVAFNPRTLAMPYPFYLIRSVEFFSSTGRYRNDIPELLEMARRGLLNLAPIRPQFFRLEEINEALDAMNTRPEGDVPLWPMMRRD